MNNAPARGRRIGRYAVRVLRAVTALLVLAFLGGWYLLETDAAAEQLRRLLETRGSVVVGAPVSIGRLQLDIVPPRIELHRVRVGEGPDPLLEVERVLVEFGAVELLARELAIENIELDRPRIALRLPVGASGGAGNSPLRSLDITIRRARIVDGEISIGDASTGIAGEVFGVNLRLDPEGVGRLGLGTGRGSGQFSIDSGRLDLTSRNGATALLTPLQLEVVYSTRPRVTDLDVVRLSIGDSTLTAEGVLRGLANVDLELRADLALADVFKVWVPPGIQDHAGRASFLGTLQMRDGAAIVAGRLNATDARFMGLDIESFSTDLQLRRGLVALRNIRSQMYGGDLRGELLVDTSSQPVRIRATYAATAIDAASFTAWDQLTGLRLAGALDAAGTLLWQKPFLETVEGNGSFTLHVADVRNAVTTAPRLDGAPNIAAGQLNDEHSPAAGQLNDEHSPAAGRQARIPSLPLPGELTVRYSVAGGTIDLETATADLPGAHLELRGSIDLDGTLAVDASFEGRDLRILDHMVAQARSVNRAPAERLGLRGAGAAQIRLTGTVQAPVLTGTVSATGLAIADLRIGDVDAELLTAEGMVTTHNLSVRRGRGRIDGEARIRLPTRGAPSDTGPGVGGSDYDVRLRLHDYPASLDVQLAGPEWTAEAVLSGDVAFHGQFGQALTGTAQLSGTNIVVPGARFDTLTLSGRKAEELWSFDRLRLGVGNGTVSASGFYGAADHQLTLDAEVSSFELAPVAASLGITAEVGGTVDGTLRLAGPVTSLSGAGTLRWRDATAASIALGSVALSLRADNGIVTARAVASPAAMPDAPGIARTAVARATPLPQSPAAGWSASATIATRFPYPAAARVAMDARIVPLLFAPLGVRLPEDLTIRGHARIDVSGALSDPEQLRGEGSIVGLVVSRGDFAARAETLRATITATRLELAGTIQTEAGTVRIAPSIVFLDGSLAGQVTGTLPANVLHLYDPSLTTAGSLELDVELAGTTETPRLRGSVLLEGLLIDADWPYPLRVERAVVEARDGRLRITDFAGSLGEQPLSLTGNLALDALTGASTAAISSLQMAVRGLPLEPLLERSPALHRLVNGGILTASVDISGSGADPRYWQGEVVLEELTLRMQQYRTELAEPVRAHIADGALTLPPSTRLVGGRTALGLRGTIDLDTLEIDLYAHGALGFEALNVLSPYWGTGGVADLELRIYGNSSDLAYQGFADLRDVVLSPPTLRQPVEHISAHLDFRDRRIGISDLRGALGGGDVTGSGEIFLRDNVPQSFNLAVRIDGAVIRLEREVRFTASADLVHDGTPERSLLSGSVDIAEMQYRRDYESERALLELLDAPETDPDPFLDSINLAITVRGNKDLFIENNLADVEVTADFNVRGTAARPVVLGRTSLLSGRLFWNGNNFDVLQGTIEFNNPFETEATFEVRARTEIRRYTIDMRFSGSLTRGVDFDYTSTPTLSDLELFNLLAFGEEPDSSTLQDRDRYQQALGLQATRYLTDAYFSEVESGARRLFGVDRFRISPTISGKETDATARVTLGKRINRNVYLTYSRLLSTSEDQLITVEYQLSRRVRVKGTRDEDGSFGIDFLVQQRIRR